MGFTKPSTTVEDVIKAAQRAACENFMVDRYEMDKANKKESVRSRYS